MYRLRRLRGNSTLRDLTAETRINVSNLVMPYFVCEGKKTRQPIQSMPGIFRLSQDELLKEIDEIKPLGIKAVILFGIPKNKDNNGVSAYQENGVIQNAVSALKKNFFNDVAVITDVCLCGYTKHGHCGVIKTGHRYEVDNDETLKILAKVALSHAASGADIVAPSAMMDGQVASIREALDKNGFKDTAIMGYSAKFASHFYGPFREAAESAMQFGDRKGYQMDFRNVNEALREIEADIREGADIVMVKPALAYLDIIARAKEKFDAPLAAYNVSGEYSMVKAYAQRTEKHLPAGRQGEQRTEMEKGLALEILTAIKRAGADIIITYHAKEISKWLKGL